ncbi:MAG TPA: hypothetical protein VL551_23265 [Actinospica sp.]|nr:hypothetical protein [Actinospica sp.]
MQTMFFTATAGELARLAGAWSRGLDARAAGVHLAYVDAADLDPAQLLELDTLATGHDLVTVREALLTPAREIGGGAALAPGALAQGTEEQVVLTVRTALYRPLGRSTDSRLRELAGRWEARSWGVDWDAERYLGLLRGLAMLSELATRECRGVYVRFDV